MPLKFILFILLLILLGSKDTDFINKASQANLAEIEAGRLAAQKAESGAVKAFADSMVADHSAAQKELMEIAEKEGVTPAGSPDTEHQRTIMQLSSLSGRKFDSAYMNMQLLDHQVAVQLFQEESGMSRDSLARGYAGKYLPKLRHHMMMAKMLWRR